MNFVTHTSTAFGRPVGDTIRTGDTIPHFQLFTVNGTPVDILTELSAGQPILLVGGNITCPVFRNNVTQINNLATIYANQVKTYIVYGVEAHPILDPSPYSTNGSVWSLENDFSSMGNGYWQYRQPTTYQEKKNLVDTLTTRMTIVPPIIIDGPCNNWWLSFGKAPTNAYLLRPNGTIYSYHGWFNRPPQNMAQDINALLQELAGVNNSDQPPVNVTLYPNPMSDIATLSIQTSDANASYSLSLYNQLGKMVKEITGLHTGDNPLTSEHIPAGIYFYRLYDNDHTTAAAGKLIIIPVK
jgi:hypothetical protein